MRTNHPVALNGYRSLQTAPDTVVLVGTGAVENSWQPIRRALLQHHRILPEGEENLAFATTILDLRHLVAVFSGGWRLYLQEGLRALSVRKAIRRALKDQLARYRELKVSISSELRAASETGGIRLRPSAAAFIKEWIGDRESQVIITTNWDLALEKEFDPEKVYHLHGHILDPQSLYLPTEQSWEPYRYFEEGQIAAPRSSNLITHGNWLVTGVRRLAIVGLSLSPLDAELRSLLMSAADAGRRSIDEVAIFDIAPEQVKRRLMYYTQNAIATIRVIDPTSVAALPVDPSKPADRSTA